MSNPRIELGKIRKATFGMGGYQEAMLGFSVTLGGDSWGVTDFTRGWARRSENAQFSVAAPETSLLKGVVRLHEILKAAKVAEVQQLVGVPVEVTFDFNTLVSWRVLTEVL